MTPEQQALMESINQKLGVLNNAEAVSKAAGTPVPTPQGGDTPEIAQKAIQGTDASETEVAIPTLQKSFEALAKSNRRFHHLGATKVLDDPRSYLRRKDAKDNYLVQNHELEDIIGALLVANKGREGLSLDDWIRQSNSVAVGQAFSSKGMPETIQRALDTTAGSALIRTDIEPLIYEAFLRQFPAYDMVRRVPANGLVHTYNQITDPGSAAVISELGDMSAQFSNSTYTRKQSTNIAIIVSPRALSLKLQFAVQQSGMNYALGGDSNLELMSAMRAIADKAQSLFFQGNSTQAAGVVGDEDGAYDANSFDGLRTQLKGASTSITKGGSQTYVSVINQAVGQLMNAGADAQSVLLFLSVGASLAVGAELISYLRILNEAPDGGFDSQLQRNGIRAIGNWFNRLQEIPSGAQAKGIGYYTFSAASTEDMYATDPSGIQFAYLGSPTPTILELPIGFNHQLSTVFYPFLMHGLVVRVLGFNRKIRIPRQTV